MDKEADKKGSVVKKEKAVKKIDNSELSLICSNIYEIRGYRVMLDFDLANIYEVENKYLKRSVR